MRPLLGRESRGASGHHHRSADCLNPQRLRHACALRVEDNSRSVFGRCILNRESADKISAARLFPIQTIADGLGEFVGGIWFLQEVHALAQHKIFSNGIRAVAAGEDHLQLRILL